MKKQVTPYTLIGLLLATLLLLSGCHTTPSIDLKTKSSGYDPLKYGQSKQPTTFENDSATQTTKPKTIAVTDISYSAEFRDAFYFEENKIKKSDTSSDIKSESTVPQIIVPNTSSLPEKQEPQESPALEKPTSTQKQSRRFDDKRVDMHTVGFMTVQANAQQLLVEPNAPTPPAVPPADLNKFQDQQDKIPGNVNKTENTKSSNLDQSYTKKYGTERKINYGEIRGLSGPIKGMLLKSGYRVVQGRPNIERPDQNDDYFDITRRIRAGDFEGADYVLYGVLAGISKSENSAPITGTENAMSINGLDISVDFSLIDTKTLQVVASFNANGSGSDNRIDGQSEGYKPNFAKIMRGVSSTLAENVAYQLGAQQFVKNEFGDVQSGSRVIPGTEKYRNDDTHLRVYK